MKILGNRVLVSRIEPPKKEGFETTEVTDSFMYMGRVEQLGAGLGDNQFGVGDTIWFAKYSPDTQDVEHEGKKYKIVKIDDVIGVL